MITEVKSIVFMFAFLSQNVSICMTEVTECANNGNLVLLCAGLWSLWTRSRAGDDGEEKSSDMEMASQVCTATATFTTSHLDQKLKFYDFFKCSVMNQNSNKVQPFPFSPQLPGRAKGENININNTK